MLATSVKLETLLNNIKSNNENAYTSFEEVKQRLIKRIQSLRTDIPLQEYDDCINTVISKILITYKNPSNLSYNIRNYILRYKVYSKVQDEIFYDSQYNNIDDFINSYEYKILCNKLQQYISKNKFELLMERYCDNLTYREIDKEVHRSTMQIRMKKIVSSVCKYILLHFDEFSDITKNQLIKNHLMDLLKYPDTMYIIPNRYKEEINYE